MSENNYSTPLIDREIFFGNPKISGAQLSPNGKYITIIKPLDGIMNIWLKKINEPFDKAIPITNDNKRPIRSYFWSRNSKYILYVQDKGGDENFRVYRIDPSIASKGIIPEAVDLTPYDDIRAMIVSLPKKDEDKIFIGINDRDKAWHDYYSIDIATGKKSLILENTEKFNGVSFDLNGELKLASRSLNDGSNEILKKTKNGFERILLSSLEESLSPLKFRKDGKIYFISNVGTPDLMGLYLYDINTNEMSLLESDPEDQVDIQNVTFSQSTDEMIATIYLGDKKRIYWKNENYERDYNFLKSQYPNSEIAITSESKDESIWIFYVNSDVDPGKAYLYKRTTKQITHLYTPRPELPTESLVHMQSVKYASSDGLKIPAYLTLPAKKDKLKVPGVVLVHGGPWARDYWGYNSFAQFLANRGYAVIQPNFRGSTGYGKAFLNSAINQWGEKMQDDLTYAADYLVSNGICESSNIAIMGGSYGGYATLAGLTFTPDTYAAGVSIVGPSNLFTLLETIPPYWESARVMFHKRMGNPNTKEGRAQLTRQSPFFHAKNIKAPLLVAQGDNDPRVKTSESDQIVIAMRDSDLPVEYINFPDEGHGFAKPKNNMAFISVMEQFLATHIGGRYQKEVPEDLNAIINNVTVDISKLVMPTILSAEDKNKALPELTHKIIDGKYLYSLNLNMQGKDIKFDVNRSIKKHGDQVVITDTSNSAMGEMLDKTILHISDFSPLERQMTQGPQVIKYICKDNKVMGSVTMNDQETAIDFASDLDFRLDGPALDIYLTLIDNNGGNIIRVFDTQKQKIVTYKFTHFEDGNIDGHKCRHCILEGIDGHELKYNLWIAKGTHPILIKKEYRILEMGGALMTMTLKNIINSN